MSAIRGRDTAPEMVVRRLLHRLGYRYRLHRHDLPGRPDIVLVSRRIVVDVRGCFWHRHADPCCRNATLPKTRREWWEAKLNRNVERDLANEAALRALGWNVLVVWECETEADAGALSDRLVQFLGLRR
jgi:DNA mismatch endonuclease Vsr